MAYQHTEQPFMHQAFVNGCGYLFAQFYMLSFGNAMHGAITDGQSIHTGFPHKFHCIQWVCIGTSLAEYMVFYAGKDTQLTFYRNPALMGVLYHFTRQFDILFKRKAAAVYHHRCISTGDSSLYTVQVTSMVQMQNYWHRAVFPIFFHGGPYVGRALYFILHRAVYKIHPASHKGVGQVCPLQNGG